MKLPNKQNLHSHTKLWHAIDYRYIHQIAHDPELNKKLGIYLNSIISSELSDRVFGLPLHERPTMGPATEVLFNNNMPSAPKDTTLPIGPDISPDAIDPFWFCYEKRGYIV